MEHHFLYYFGRGIKVQIRYILHILHSQRVIVSGEREMSGAGKKVTEAAFEASKSIDWDAMTKLSVSDEAR